LYASPRQPPRPARSLGYLTVRKSYPAVRLAEACSGAADTLTYYVVGHTIEEQLAVAQPSRGHDAAARLTDAVDPRRHPYMYAALAHIPAPHHQEHFDYGLHLVVNGIRSDTAPAPQVT
jgi:Tetracyclin repressor-like, C-terminal domain